MLQEHASPDDRIIPALLHSIAAVHGRKYLLLGLLKLASDALNFSGPLLLNALLHFLSQSSQTRSHHTSESGLPAEPITGWPMRSHTAGAWSLRNALWMLTASAGKDADPVQAWQGYGLVAAIVLTTVLKVIGLGCPAHLPS